MVGKWERNERLDLKHIHHKACKTKVQLVFILTYLER